MWQHPPCAGDAGSRRAPKVPRKIKSQTQHTLWVVPVPRAELSMRRAAVPVPSPVTGGRHRCALARRSELGVRLLVVLVLVAGARPRQRLGRVVALLVLALGGRQLLLCGATRSASVPSAPCPYPLSCTLYPILALGSRIHPARAARSASAPSARSARAPGLPRGLQVRALTADLMRGASRPSVHARGSSADTMQSWTGASARGAGPQLC
jgi:hypothetical protein